MNSRAKGSTIAQCTDDLRRRWYHEICLLNLQEMTGPFAQCTEPPQQQPPTIDPGKRNQLLYRHGPVGDCTHLPESRGQIVQCTEYETDVIRQCTELP